MIEQYRKKPVVIDAIKWNGKNADEIIKWSEGSCRLFNGNGSLLCETLEGQTYASKNDYIIRGVKGEFYPCKPDIFEETYEKVDNLENTYASLDKHEFRKYIYALRKCADEHEKDFTPTCSIRVSDLCKDTANLLERLLNKN